MDKFWKNIPKKPSDDEQKTQIVPRFAPEDATQLVKPPVSDDATQLVKPPISNADAEEIPEGIMMEDQDIPEGIIEDETQFVKRPAMDETIIVKPPVMNVPPMLPKQSYEMPNHNMTQLVQKPKPVEVLPPPPIEPRLEMGEPQEAMPAFVKWIGGLALLVLLFNLGHCLMN
jgi:hypothetical protein